MTPDVAILAFEFCAFITVVVSGIRRRIVSWQTDHRVLLAVAGVWVLSLAIIVAYPLGTEIRTTSAVAAALLTATATQFVVTRFRGSYSVEMQPPADQT